MIINFLVTILMLSGAVAAKVSPGPTFNKDVLPILQKNCQTCHRPGQIAPMSFSKQPGKSRSEQNGLLG
jgi:hypothetical protein